MGFDIGFELDAEGNSRQEPERLMNAEGLLALAEMIGKLDQYMVDHKLTLDNGDPELTVLRPQFDAFAAQSGEAAVKRFDDYANFTGGIAAGLAKKGLRDIFSGKKPVRHKPSEFSRTARAYLGAAFLPESPIQPAQATELLAASSWVVFQFSCFRQMFAADKNVCGAISALLDIMHIYFRWLEAGQTHSFAVVIDY